MKWFVSCDDYCNFSMWSGGADGSLLYILKNGANRIRQCGEHRRHHIMKIKVLNDDFGALNEVC
jgi:hypothetical protein